MHRRFLIVVALAGVASGTLTGWTGALGDATSARTIDQRQSIAASDVSVATDGPDGDRTRIETAERLLGAGTRENFDEASALLRAVVQNDSGEYGLRAMRMLVRMGDEIRKEFPHVSDQAIEDAHGSVGVALSRMDEFDTAIDVLIREAWLLRAPAQIMLALQYEHYSEGFRPYDPRILKFYRDSAAAGIERSKLELGRILLYGWGVKRDIDRAAEFLRSVDYPEAHMALADLAIERDQPQAAVPHLLVAAKAGLPRALYNLGVMLQVRKMYGLAAQQFEMLLKYHPDHMGGRLELARMYAEGMGVDRDERKGFEMMMQVVERAEGRVRALAHANIGIFYMQGRGVARSLPKARFHLMRAVEGGVTEVEKYLPKIRKN